MVKKCLTIKTCLTIKKVVYNIHQSRPLYQNIFVLFPNKLYIRWFRFWLASNYPFFQLVSHDPIMVLSVLYILHQSPLRFQTITLTLRGFIRAVISRIHLYSPRRYSCEITRLRDFGVSWRRPVCPYSLNSCTVYQRLLSD
jgi:hypothetical protein